MGRAEGTTILQARRLESNVSYLSHPDFARDPHSSLAISVNVDLRCFRSRTLSYLGSDSPLILHRKEEFVRTDDPGNAKFTRLTRAEIARGLFDDHSTIGPRRGWLRALLNRRLALRCHWLVSLGA